MLSPDRLAHGLVLALVGGALGALGLAPFGLWPLGIVGLGLLHAALGGHRARRRVAIGFAFGAAYLLIGFAFVWHFSALGYFVLVAFESAFFGLAGALAGRRGGPGAFAGALVAAEWLRGVWPFDGVPVATLALGQAEGPLACLARLGGPLLVTFATAVIAAAAAAACRRVLARRRRSVPAERAARGSVAALAAVALLAVFSAALAPRGGAAVAHVRAAAVQGGGPRGLTSLQSSTRGALAATLAESDTLPASVALVVWPEDVVALPGPLSTSPARATLAAQARARRATLLVGLTVDAPGARFYNEIVVFSPTGRLVARFEKVRDVPFGEFVPFRSLLRHVASFAAVPRNAIPGRGTGAVATPVGRLGILVSYEAYFASRGRAAVRAGAEALVTETNTASYATSQVPATELDASRLQAIALGRDLLQAATTGYSALVSPTGAVSGRTVLGRAARVDVDLPLRRGSTIYEVLGDVPVLWAGVVLVALGLRRPRRRAARPAAGR